MAELDPARLLGNYAASKRLAAFCGKQRPGRIGLALRKGQAEQASKRASEPTSEQASKRASEQPGPRHALTSCSAHNAIQAGHAETY